MPRAVMTVRTMSVGTGRTVVIRGEVDSTTVETVEDALAAAMRSEVPGELVVDLTGVTFMGAVAVRALDRAYWDAAARGWEMWVHVAAHSVPERVLTLTSARHCLLLRVREHPISEHTTA